MKLLLYSCLACLLLIMSSAVAPTTYPPTWYGVITFSPAPRTGFDHYMVPGAAVFQNGYAEVKQELTRDNRFWTALCLDIPCDKNISGDNMKIEWYAKSNLSNRMKESDLGVDIYCANDTISMNTVPANSTYNILRYGKVREDKVYELDSDVGHFAKYAIKVSGGKLQFYLDDEMKKELSNDQLLGQAKTITIHFKGTGRVDWVKLYEGEKLVMEDEFDNPGVSHIALA